MKNVNRMQTTPVKYPRSKRNHAIAKITSLDAGVVFPIAMVPLFRGDGIGGRKSGNGKWSSSRIGFAVEMAETKDRIANKVRARFSAYCVPNLAFARFNGSRDEMDKSFAGEQGLGGTVIPFVETFVAGAHGASPILKAMGLHAAPGTMLNTAYIEAYNLVDNYRATNRSQDLAPRARLDHTLAKAYWHAGRFEHLVPDFDDATMDGRVSLEYTSNQIRLRQVATIDPAVAGATVLRGNANGLPLTAASSGVSWYPLVGQRTPENGAAAIFAELADGGLTVSLANIEMAKNVQGFAALRKKFEGHDDDYIIDTFLMNGLRIPDQAMKQPFLLAEETVEFSQAQRYATDSGNLDEKAVSGYAEAMLTLRCPTLDVGGVVVILVEILPDQLWERQKDPYLHSVDTSTWPEAMRDFADPEKVDIVKNGDIDVDHATPNGRFGFAPLNWLWNAWGPGLGGMFFKPAAGGGVNVLRQHFWAHETVNPALSEAFYRCMGLTKSIFLDEASPGFQLTAQGNVVIDGLTQFGRELIEATDNYEKVMDQMDQTRVKED